MDQYLLIPFLSIFRGMNIHLPAILMFTRGTRFWHTAICVSWNSWSERSESLDLGRFPCWFYGLSMKNYSDFYRIRSFTNINWLPLARTNLTISSDPSTGRAVWDFNDRARHNYHRPSALTWSICTTCWSLKEVICWEQLPVPLENWCVTVVFLDVTHATQMESPSGQPD